MVGAVTDRRVVLAQRGALVHDYLTQLGGAERVAGQIARLHPEYALHTSVHDRREVPLDFVGGRDWRTSRLQVLAGRLPLKLMLPLLPGAAASLDLRDRELVVSSSSAFAHHARASDDAVHVCYCHTPPRFLWQPESYFLGRPRLQRALSPLLGRLRELDLAVAARVDAYVAVSQTVATRIRSTYGREARVVYPPVDVESFQPSAERSGRFLVVSRLVPSKRVELVVEAANRHKLPLDVIGKGPELARLQRLAGPTVRLLGWQPDAAVRRAMAACEALVVAADEDFGLVMVEAQASGRPPVALARGGATEIIEDGVTGFLFDEQTPDAIAAAMQRARAGHLDLDTLIEAARRFDLAVFARAFDSAIEAALCDRRTAAPMATVAR